MVPLAGQVEGYLAALAREIETRASLIPSAGAETIYVGGGTPTLAGEEWLKACLTLIRRHLYGSATREWSVESLPGYITPALAAMLVDVGVTRVTLGVQSLDPAVLAEIGRADQLGAFWKAIEILRAAGITSIGADLILGLPGERIDRFREGLEQLIAARLPHLSAYMLYLEPGSIWNEQRRKAPDWLLRRLYTALTQRLVRAGYQQYEVSNFALPGFACRHNLNTWAGRDLAGFGLAAVGTISTKEGVRVRRQNTRNLGQYLADPLSGYSEEYLSRSDLYNERLMLGLRSQLGLPLDCAFAKDYGQSVEGLRARLEEFTRAGLLQITAQGWQTTLKGRLWLDSLLVELFCT